MAVEQSLQPQELPQVHCQAEEDAITSYQPAAISAETSIAATSANPTRGGDT